MSNFLFVTPPPRPCQVPVSEHFVFAQSGSSGSSSGTDLIVTSSNSGLAGQEGLDRTAVDIQLFATGAVRLPAQAQAQVTENLHGKLSIATLL